MPCDYSKYPKNWKSEIRPAILERANNCCEICGIKNHILVIRGTWNGLECYQDEGGNIFDANTSKQIGEDYLGEVHPTNRLIKVVLTIMHLDHNTENNEHSNLKAACQRCHNRHDILFRKNNRKVNKGVLDLFD